MTARALGRRVGDVEHLAGQIAQKRGTGLPGERDMAMLLCLLAGSGDGWHGRATAGAEALDDGDSEGVCASLLSDEVAPGVQTLLDCFGRVLVALVAQDVAAYKAAVKELRSALRGVLAARPAWRSSQGDVHFGADLGRLGRGFGLVTQAGQALRFATEELSEWQAWYGGGAEKMHRFYEADRLSGTCFRRGHAERWLSDCQRHTLPPEEVAVLVGRGLVTQEQLDAVAALPPISDGLPSQGEKIAAALDAALDGVAT